MTPDHNAHNTPHRTFPYDPYSPFRGHMEKCVVVRCVVFSEPWISAVFL